ncbi:MAG: VOC family protein [Pseudonocardiaceae bacterium]
MTVTVPDPVPAAALGVQIVIDCTDPSGLAEFWAEALAYVVEPPPPGFDSWDEFAEHIGIPPKDRDRLAAVVDPDRVRPRVLFQKVPETKEVKNRVHLDIDVAPGIALDSEERKAAARARSTQLTSRGATLLRELDEPAGWCLVMADPEGNEFCLH